MHAWPGQPTGRGEQANVLERFWERGTCAPRSRGVTSGEEVEQLQEIFALWRTASSTNEESVSPSRSSRSAARRSAGWTRRGGSIAVLGEELLCIVIAMQVSQVNASARSAGAVGRFA